jgi:hypothetical protein
LLCDAAALSNFYITQCRQCGQADAQVMVSTIEEFVRASSLQLE